MELNFAWYVSSLRKYAEFSSPSVHCFQDLIKAPSDLLFYIMSSFFSSSVNESGSCSLLSAESDHRRALPDFVTWCDDSLLDLNVLKTKELIIDFRKNVTNTSACRIHGEDVEMVNSYKYLGTVFDSQLKFDIKSESVVKRVQHRVDLLSRIIGVSRSLYCVLVIYWYIIVGLVILQWRTQTV